MNALPLLFNYDYDEEAYKDNILAIQQIVFKMDFLLKVEVLATLGI